LGNATPNLASLYSTHFNLLVDWGCHENVMKETQRYSNESGTNAEEKGSKADFSP
jgi:hypothetical protein